MADAELEIIVRLRSLVAEEAARIKTQIDALGRGVETSFIGAAQAEQRAAEALGAIQGEAAVAAQGVASVGSAAAAAGGQVAAAAQAADLSPVAAEAAGAAVAVGSIGPAAATSGAVVQAMGVQTVQAATQAAGAQVGAATATAGVGAAALAAGAAETGLGAAGVEAGRAVSAGAEEGTSDTRALADAIQRAAEEIRKATDAMNKGGQSGAESTKKAAGSFGLLGGAATAAGSAIRAAFAPLAPILATVSAALVFTTGIRQAAEVDRALADISAQADITGTALAALRTEALDTSRSLGLKDADAAKALLQAVTDGARSAGEGLEVFRASAELSVAAGGDVAQATDLITSAVNAYREENVSAARAADVFFAVVKAGKAEVSDLAGGLDRVLPIAASLGVSLEDLGSVLAAATLGGADAGQAITALRSALGGLVDVNRGASDEAKALRDRLEEQGVSLDAASIRARGLVETLQAVERAIGGDAEAVATLFPDMRSLSGILAILSDDGRNLAAALRQVEGSAGLVGAAIERRLASPAAQLSVIFRELLGSFSDAFGGAFLRGVQTAVNAMGGLEGATKSVGLVGESVGTILGTVFPAIGESIGSAADSVRDFVDSIGGTDELLNRIRAAADALGRAIGASVRIVMAELRALVEFVALVPDAFRQARAEIENLTSVRLIGPSAEEELGLIRQQFDLIEGEIKRHREALRLIEAVQAAPDDATRASLQAQLDVISEMVLSATELRRALKDTGHDFGFSDDIEATFDSLQKAIERLQSRKLKVELEIQGETTELSGIGDQFQAVLDRLSAELAQRSTEFNAAGAEIGEAFTAGVGQGTRRSAEVVRAELARTTQEIDAGRQELDLLGSTAREAFRVFEGSTRRSLLRAMAEDATSVKAELDRDTNALAALTAELDVLVTKDISVVEDQLRLAERAFVDAREQAELLGITDPSQLAEAIETIEESSQGAGAEVDRLRAKLEALKAELAELRALAPSVEVTARVAGPAIDGVLDQFKAGLRLLGTFARDAFKDIPLDVESIFERVAEGNPFEEMERSFAGGELALERQTELIDAQVLKQRSAVFLLRELGLLDEKRIGHLEEATDQLEASRDAILDQNAAAARSVRLDAAELGVEVSPELDTDASRRALDALEERLALEARAAEVGIPVGLNIDDEALTRDVAAAERAFDEAMEEIRRRALEQDAIQFGVEVDGQSLRQLELDVARARQDAQRFADNLGATRARNDAILLGINVDDRGLDDILREIARVRVEAETFAAENPIGSQLLVSGVNEASNALAQVALDSDNAREHLSNFFSSMATQAAQAAAQLLIVRSLLAVFGGIPGAPEFIAAAFPGFAARGMVVGPGGAPVHAFAQGALPDHIVTSPHLAPMAALAGTAVVPLSGGGVETTAGDHLPMVRQGARLVVQGYARGGAFALYGEAGDEAVAQVHRSRDGRPGLLAESGAVLPLTRVAGGRLGVEARALGGYWPMAAGGIPVADRPAVLPVGQQSSTLIVREREASEPREIRVEVSPQITLNVASLDPRTAGDVILAQRQAIATAVAQEIARSPQFKAAIRGDRS